MPLTKTPTLDDALAIAVEAHKGQKDKNGEPYILHPLRVMLSASNDDERIVAVLHDVVEDSHFTISDLMRRGFSDRVIRALQAITRQAGELYYPYIARVRDNELARAVKKMDLLDNLRDGNFAGAQSLRVRYMRALAILK